MFNKVVLAGSAHLYHKHRGKLKKKKKPQKLFNQLKHSITIYDVLL